LVVRPQIGIGRGQRLGGVQRLRADLAHMVHTHQASGQVFFLLRQLSCLVCHRGAGFGGMGLGKQGAQGCVAGDQQLVGGGVHK